MSELRIVFDVGSGGTKSAKVCVDTGSGRVKILKEINRPFGYQYYISNSEDYATLAEDNQNGGLEVLLGIMGEYEQECSNIKCAGIATAWARKGHDSNISGYLEKLASHGFHIKKLSQKDEGRYGYDAVTMSLAAKGQDPGNILVWDIGGGSFQLTMELEFGVHVYNGLYGSANFAADLRKHLKKPAGFLDQAEAVRAANWTRVHVGNLISQDAELSAKLASSVLSVFGIGQFLNKGIKSLVDQREYITLSEVDALINIFAGAGTDIDKMTQQYPGIEPQFLKDMQTNLILAGSIMDALHVDKVDFFPANSIDAIAIDETIWSSVQSAWEGDCPVSG